MEFVDNNQVQATPARLLSLFQHENSVNRPVQQHQDSAHLDSLDEFEDSPWQRAQTLPPQFSATSPKQVTCSHGLPFGPSSANLDSMAQLPATSPKQETHSHGLPFGPSSANTNSTPSGFSAIHYWLAGIFLDPSSTGFSGRARQCKFLGAYWC